MWGRLGSYCLVFAERLFARESGGLLEKRTQQGNATVSIITPNLSYGPLVLTVEGNANTP